MILTSTLTTIFSDEMLHIKINQGEHCLLKNLFSERSNITCGVFHANQTSVCLDPHLN